ncbi:RluA family pseudouridine synthase [Spiroplasma endosymbiont of Notiophilus biguttatus]|uniref:RluA family pseudouridine synthase n=1 Tax=Spiroplasma endosymbiont of Notiophilus biguttatus TaxID=3066285 RepID=UPI00313E26CD
MIKLTYHENKNIRIDKYLAMVLTEHHYSRNFIQNLIINGQVIVNNKTISSANLLLKNNDEINIIIKNEKKNTLKATAIDFEIIYEDNEILVINKPNNLIVHPGAGNWDNTLVNGLLFQSKIENIDENNLRPGIVHRIDKQTTGLLLVAKNKISHYILAEQLQKHEIKRIYIALVHGTIKGRSGTIKAPIARSNNNRLKMMVNEQNSKKATTHFTVIERFKDYTLIQCQLETGRTHQIRVHFEWIEHPIVNDPLYSKFKLENANIGQYLHAKVITFTHPTTKKVMTFECNLPDFFENKLQLLRKESVK